MLNWLTRDRFNKACLDGNGTEALAALSTRNSNLTPVEGFMIACQLGSVEAVKAIADGKLSVSFSNGFIEACEFGRINVIDYMLTNERLAPYCSIERGLDVACCNGHLETVQYLVEEGASNLDGVLESICNEPIEQWNIARYLVSMGAFEGFDIDYGLEAACMHGHMHLAKLMVDNWVIDASFLPLLLGYPDLRFLSVFLFYDMFPEATHESEDFKEAVHELCDVFLTLQTKRIPNEIIRVKIFPYL
jgi:hypothetical protein